MKIDMKSPLTYVTAWLAATGLALGLAVASPSESSVMGRLPEMMSHALAHKPLSLSTDLPSDRTLALITFERSQRALADSWIHGLNLNNDSTIAWMRMPVLNDPGTASGRSAVETRLLQRYASPGDRARLVPVFADRADFVRSAGLKGTDQFYAVVVNRDGDVLARVEGQFDANKAEILRETLKSQNL
ncbi:hypothetical protein [Polaromonas sp.]|uniref:hypothetical protein n=1 Tax=Polaromonas sp. TaxID=1869339 RepID=UPI002600841E|nr:hypothetical protein [Polaromonas sp.]